MLVFHACYEGLNGMKKDWNLLQPYLFAKDKYGKVIYDQKVEYWLSNRREN